MKRILAMTTAAAMTAASAIAFVPASATAMPSGAYSHGYHSPGSTWRDGRRDRRHYRHRDRDRNWGAAAAGTLFGLTLGAAINADRGYRGDNWNAHVRWCLNRFDTYNPRTDLYFYRPGQQRHCNSPYT